jgi:cell division protease FtsH
VNAIARSMVVRWGMSPKIGPLNITQPGDGQIVPADQLSDETRRLLDEEERRIVEECHSEAVALLEANRSRLDALASALLAKDTLDEKEILEVTGLNPKPGRTMAPPLARAPDGDRRPADAVSPTTEA